MVNKSSVSSVTTQQFSYPSVVGSPSLHACALPSLLSSGPQAPSLLRQPCFPVHRGNTSFLPIHTQSPASVSISSSLLIQGPQ